MDIHLCLFFVWAIFIFVHPLSSSDYVPPLPFASFHLLNDVTLHLISVEGAYVLQVSIQVFNLRIGTLRSGEKVCELLWREYR